MGFWKAIQDELYYSMGIVDLGGWCKISHICSNISNFISSTEWIIWKQQNGHKQIILYHQQYIRVHCSVVDKDSKGEPQFRFVGLWSVLSIYISSLERGLVTESWKVLHQCAHLPETWFTLQIPEGSTYQTHRLMPIPSDCLHQHVQASDLQTWTEVSPSTMLPLLYLGIVAICRIHFFRNSPYKLRYNVDRGKAPGIYSVKCSLSVGRSIWSRSRGWAKESVISIYDFEVVLSLVYVFV